MGGENSTPQGSRQELAAGEMACLPAADPDLTMTALPSDTPRRPAGAEALSASEIVRLENGPYRVTLALTPAERDEIFRLRYRIFNEEMGEGLPDSCRTGMDIDRYDRWCDLLVIRQLPEDRAVGTYRILRKSVALAAEGFYSETEFDLARLKERGEDFMEVGRSCVDPAFRDGTVINLLWAGLAQYVDHYGIAFLFGCASVHRTDPEHVQAVDRLLRGRFPAEPGFAVRPRPENRLPYLDDDPAPGPADADETFRALPPLLKGYLRLGARVCGPPAYDPQFRCVDYLFLLPTAGITRRYRRHYFRDEGPPG